jgi:hypothetical protein
MNIADVITAVSVAVAALAFVVGVNAWRREFIGKRRIELIGNVLALFYEAQDAIREIRNPFGFVGEGKTRKRSDYESEEEAKILDSGYVVFERYRKREKLFAEIRSMKYRVMATFGSNAGKPFDELNMIMNEIFSAAEILGSYYWKRQGRVRMSEEEFKKHLEEMYKYEAVFWFKGDENDEITPRVQHTIEKLEAIARKESMMKSSWFSKREKDNHKSKNRA